MRRTACVFASIALALSACSSPDDGEAGPESEETTAAEAATEAEETEEADEADEATPSEEPENTEESAAGDEGQEAEEDEESQEGDGGCVPPVPDAYPCAGGPRPAEARLLAEFPRSEIVPDRRMTGLIMPSGNIMCDIYPDFLGCYVESWDRDEMMPGLDPRTIGGGVTVELGLSGPTKLGLISEAPAVDYEKLRGTAVTRPEYGSVWYYEDFVLASTEKGLTVWNTKTGYGALMNRSGYYPFSR